MSQPVQLTIPIQQHDIMTLEHFVVANNEHVLNSLRHHLTPGLAQTFYIDGKHASGKSHLLKAWCYEFYQQQRKAAYIPLKKFSAFNGNAVLSELEKQDLICIDDLQEIAGDRHWETALFNLFNRVKDEQYVSLIVSGDKPLSEMGITLPDLVSRLSWGESYHLKRLTDDKKLQVLHERAYIQGLHIPDEVSSFLIKRTHRDLSSLLETLQKLDDASLQEKRKLTIPFVKSVLNL